MPRMGKKLFKQEIENVVVELEALKASQAYTQRMIELPSTPYERHGRMAPSSPRQRLFTLACGRVHIRRRE